MLPVLSPGIGNRMALRHIGRRSFTALQSKRIEVSPTTLRQSRDKMLDYYVNLQQPSGKMKGYDDCAYYCKLPLGLLYVLSIHWYIIWLFPNLRTCPPILPGWEAESMKLIGCWHSVEIRFWRRLEILWMTILWPHLTPMQKHYIGTSFEIPSLTIFLYFLRVIWRVKSPCPFWFLQGVRRFLSISQSVVDHMC